MMLTDYCQVDSMPALSAAVGKGRFCRVSMKLDFEPGRYAKPLS